MSDTIIKQYQASHSARRVQLAAKQAGLIEDKAPKDKKLQTDAKQEDLDIT